MIVVRYAYKEVFYTRVSRMDDNDTFYQTLSGIWLSYKKCYKYSFFFTFLYSETFIATQKSRAETLVWSCTLLLLIDNCTHIAKRYFYVVH